MPRYRATIIQQPGRSQRAFFHAPDKVTARQKLSDKGYDLQKVSELVEVPEIAESTQVIPCPACGVAVSHAASACVRCGHPIAPRGDATGGLIPYKNPQALTAYYLGLFSLFPFLGLFLAVAALVLGLRGLQERKRNPEIKGGVHAWIGVTLGAVFTVVWGLVDLLIVVGIVIAIMDA